MVGDSLNGIWNETEAISLIFKVRVHRHNANAPIHA
jgi:hypothetical protein